MDYLRKNVEVISEEELLKNFMDDNKKTALVVDCSTTSYRGICRLLEYMVREGIKPFDKMLLLMDGSCGEQWKQLKEYAYTYNFETIMLCKYGVGRDDLDGNFIYKLARLSFHNGYDSFAIASSNPSYWEDLMLFDEDADFLVFVENSKRCDEVEEWMYRYSYDYIYLDDSNEEKTTEMKGDAV